MRLVRRRAIFSAVSAGMTVMIAGTLGYMLIEGMTLIDALYMTTITVTTIGFKEVAPLSTGGQIFTIVMAFAGIGVILFTGTEMARVVIEGNLRRYFDKRWEHTMLKRLSNHIVVCGHGRLGRAVVEELQDHKQKFAVVESNPEICRALEGRRIPFVQGDATKEKALLAAGIERARTFLSCMGDDALNVYAIMLARQLQPEITIVGLAVEDDSDVRLALAGAQKVINPYRLGGKRLALTAIKPAMMDFIDDSLLDSNLGLELAEITVEKKSALDGKTLVEAHVRRNFGVIVVATKRGNETKFNPDSDFRMERGDILVVLGPLDAIEEAENAASGRT